MEVVQLAVDELYKEHFGKMIAALLYSSRDIDPETAEDIVQDSFSTALVDWEKNGVPINPAGWIYKVCRHKALNKIKKEKRIEKLDDQTPSELIEVRFSESVLDDPQLKLLFACAHPDLSPKIQVVITLKYVANLRVEAIAKILAMTIDGVDKLLLRARQKIRDEKILLEEPQPLAWKQRLSGVHKVLYLIFNEGYKASWGKQMMREELCEDALIMTKTLLDSSIANEETKALYALMLFNSGRFKSRFNSSGELIDLEMQDRSLWNKDLIMLASHMLNQSHSETISSYHIEASIACLHCSASNFETTDWNLITKLYAQLLLNNPNPFVELNYAIALYYNEQKDKAFKLLHALTRHPFLSQYYLLNATLGKFYQKEGESVIAHDYLAKALEQTHFEKEKDFIQKMFRNN